MPYVDPPTGTIGGFRPLKGDLTKYVIAVLAILAIALGIAGVVYGEADDSPGLQLIGVLLIVGAIALVVKTARSAKKLKQS
jgi:hypothetical protein